MNHGKLLLGQQTDYPDNYSPELLFPIPRMQAREPLGLTRELPFTGADIWNAWELTWLGSTGQPQVATAEIVVPAESPNIVESKSLKLYLNSFAMSRFSSQQEVTGTLQKDLSACVGAALTVSVLPIEASQSRRVSRLAGACLDAVPVTCTTWEVDAGLLGADRANIVAEDLHTHVLRSLCPVTGQPDSGSVQISYIGPKINQASLLRYIVSFRRHQDFHEACVERMFLDILQRCRPEKLSVHGRYQRRGGIDINPFRSNDPRDKPLNLRLWRQ